MASSPVAVASGRGPKPLLVRLPNYVGDAVMAWPTIDRLRRHGWLPTLIGKPWAADLLSGTGLVIATYPRKLRQRITSLRELARQTGATTALLLTHSFSSAAEARLAGLSPVGYRKDGRGWLLAGSPGAPPPGHLVQGYWQLADRFCPAEPLPEWLELPITDHAKAMVDQRLHQQLPGLDGSRGGWVLLCPQAGGQHRGQSKDWPHFAALAWHIHRRGWMTLATPGPGELEAFRSELPESLLLDRLGLAEVAAVAGHCALAVANDCGLGHVAAAAGTPIVSVFGSTDPGRVRPWSNRATVIGDQAGWPALETVLEAIDRQLPRW